MSIKKPLSSLSKLYTIYEEPSENFLDKTDLDSCFYSDISDMVVIDNRNVRASRGSNKKISAFKLFQFCNLQNQQCFILEEEVSVSLHEPAVILNTLRQFWKQYDRFVKFPLYLLAKVKQAIGYTFFKDELFAHCFQDIKEHWNRQTLFFDLSVTRSANSPSESLKMLVSKKF